LTGKCALRDTRPKGQGEKTERTDNGRKKF
jgi:hypothetical protein